MAKHSRAQSRQEQFRRICDSLFRDRKALQSLTRAKNELDPASYPELIQWIHSRLDVRRRLFPVGPKAQFTQLQRYRSAEPASLNRELAWAAANLMPHTEMLTQYASRQRTFVRAFLKGDAETAIATLDALDEAMGPTLWGVTSRIAALQQFRGLEAQKSYVRELKEDAPPLNLAAFLAYHVSVRNETTVTLRNFREEREDIIARSQSAGPSMLLVVRYYVLCEVPSNDEDLARLLATGTNGSICDYYDLFLDCCRAVEATSSQSAGAAFSALNALSSIDDPQQRNIEFALDPRSERVAMSPGEGTTRAWRLFGRFLDGDATVASEVESEYFNEPASPEWLELAARTYQRDQKMRLDVPSDAVRTLLYRILARAGNSEGAADSLAKVAMNIRGTQWAAAVAGYLGGAAVAEPDKSASAATMFALAALEPATPWFHQLAPLNKLARYRQAAAPSASSNESQRLVAALYDPNENAQTLVRAGGSQGTLAASLFALRRGDLKLAEQLALEGLQSPDLVVRTRSVQLAAWAQLYARNFGRCIETVSKAVLENSDLAHVCPVRELADAIPAATRAELGGNIGLSVFYDIAAKILGTAYDVQRKDAFDDFLAAFNVERPSQLPANFYGGDSAAGIYFLAQLCVAPILETSLGGYRTDEELGAERVEICSRLVRLDEANASKYEDEIKSIIREGMVGKRVREIDQNRVYVDLEGIRQTAIRKLAEPYQRYQDFLRHGIVVAPAQNAADDEAILTAAYSAPVTEGGLFALPENEPASLLAALVSEIADLYFLSPAHGLERYLSTRIRHGVLEGHLRTPLAEEQLVSSRIKATNLYEPNRFWVKRLGITDAADAGNLEKRLARFSRAFDDRIQHLSSNRIRAARAGPSNPALFQYAVKPSFVRLMAAALTATTPIEDFVGGVLTAMRTTLDDFLPQVRKAIQDTKEEAASLLVSLQKDVYKICERAQRDPVPFEVALSRAGTALQREFAHVESWFFPGGSGSAEPFTLELAVDVAARSVRALAHGFTCQVRTIGHSQEWAGRATLYLPRIVDLLFPALQNAAEYGNGGPSAAAAVVELRHDERESRVRITNELSTTSNRPALIAELARLKAEQDDGTYITLVATEGGTGLHKLRSHLEETVVEPRFTFGIEQNEFIVEFTLPSPASLV